MFIIPIQLTTTMNSSHFHSHGWASGTTSHLGFSDMHPHLDDSSHIFDELIKSSQLAVASSSAPQQPPKAKVLFQFFDGWPMTKS